VHVLDFSTVVSSFKSELKKYCLCALHGGFETHNYIRSSKVALHDQAQTDKQYNLHSLYGRDTTTKFRL